jgi:circadian clock protein KaiB
VPLLLLYVAGAPRRHARLIDVIRREGQAVFGQEFPLTIVDVLQDPAAAERDNILATPTLLVRGVHGSRRLIGDLSNAAAVGSWLRSY